MPNKVSAFIRAYASLIAAVFCFGAGCLNLYFAQATSVVVVQNLDYALASMNFLLSVFNLFVFFILRRLNKKDVELKEKRDKLLAELDELKKVKN